MAEKIYCLDTNVLVHDPQALFAFVGARVAIPGMVLEELDQFKREGTDRGRSSRHVIQQLDHLRERGSLGQGVALDNGSIVSVVFLTNSAPHIPFKMEGGDNEILLTALELKQNGYEVIFISKDINARVKADALGLETQDYRKEYVTEEEFYKGWRRFSVPSIQLKQENPSIFDDIMESSDPCTINEFILLESQNNPHNYRVYRFMGGRKFMPVNEPKLNWPLRPRNAQQLMALNLLLDNSIKFIDLFGPAGTGKTFLALLAGLHQVLVEETFEKILVARPVVPLGKDIGFLPGSLQEKLATWMFPIYDNMEFIVHRAHAHKHLEDVAHEYSFKDKGDKWERNGKKDRSQGKRHEKHDKPGRLAPLDELVRRGRVSLEAITYMRGRSIPYQYILIDEAQNLTPHEIKTLVSRVGEGSKIILAGDPYQIDAPYLDFSSNGLVVSNERFKGQPIFGSVYLETSERSELSQLAGKLL